ADISSNYAVGQTQEAAELEQIAEMEQSDNTNVSRTKKPKQNCNQGIGNGAEGCDPGNSRPHGGSNDEGGRTPGGRR
ncbi:MAG: S-layer homology domain-containing protein, partial [Rivularia sp. (in: cyanobacteria)]